MGDYFNIVLDRLSKKFNYLFLYNNRMAVNCCGSKKAIAASEMRQERIKELKLQIANVKKEIDIKKRAMAKRHHELKQEETRLQTLLNDKELGETNIIQGVETQ